MNGLGQYMKIKMSNVYLCSFASPDLYRSKLRFLSQAKSIGIYKGIKIFSFEDLSKSKKKQIQRFIKNKKKRLFGYGCWKAEIIKNYIKKLPKNSILQYSDIGCHLNKNGIVRLKKYINLCKKKNMITFQYKIPKSSHFKNFSNYKYQRYFEYEYTKMDLFKYLNITKKEIFNSEQIMSGIIFLKNNNYSLNILNKWEEILKYNHLINDAKSLIPNHNNFIEHRHDQSVFSLICKQKKVYTLSSSECEWAEFRNKRTWEHLNNFPILAFRDKKYNLLKRFFERQKKNINRFINK